VKLNWCRSCGPGGQNFGDLLGPRLLEHFGIGYEWAPAPDADIVTVGSILSQVPNGWRGTVLGTGYIAAGMRRDLRNANVLALRGEATVAASRLRRRPLSLGDPGILVPLLHERAAEGSDLVIVPHYVDHEMVKRYPNARVVDITGPADEVVAGISGAGRIVTSSLHAYITADAFGIPASVEPHERVVGGLFKFRDYASAFGERSRPNVFRVTPRAAMEARQRELADLFRAL
jgi:pyruvyltransferase